jgi:hypothetical protein
MSGNREEAAAAVQRALLACAGPGAAEQLALAQLRLAYAEVAAEAGLAREPLRSRLTGVVDGIGQVTASESILAQELTLRAEALTWAINQRLAGRPGATIRLRGLAISVGRDGG